MDLLTATTDLVETTKKLALWNESLANSQEYEKLNNVIQNGKKDMANQILNEMLSNETSGYDILNKVLEDGYIDIAYFMLDKDCEVNKESFVPSYTPLHNAVKLRESQMVKKLLEKGASISAVDSNRDSPLHLAYNSAFISKDNQLVDLILAHIEETSSYINIKNQHGLSHLHIASARGNAQAVRKFIEAGANLLDYVYDDAPVHAGYTALDFACDIKSLDVIKLCRQIFPSKINLRNFVCENMIKKNNLILKVIQWSKNDLENYEVKLDQFREEIGDDKLLSDFHMTCFLGNYVAVESFLDDGQDVNDCVSRNAEYCPLYTALHFALESHSQRYEKMRLLLDNDADVYKRNGFGMTALHLAMYTYDNEVLIDSEENRLSIELLYNHVEGKETNPMDSNGLTYFHIAVAMNDVNLIKQFLDSGEDVNQSVLSNLRAFSNYTPLHFAARYSNEVIGKLLIEHGAEIDPQEGMTPLQIALKFGCCQMIDLLLEHNANVNIVTSKDKLTALHLLVKYNYLLCQNTEKDLQKKQELIGFVDKLVDLGVDVNAKNSNGFTALHLACLHIYNGIWLIERLLSAGADINLKNSKGETPLDVARICADRSTYDDLLLLYHHVQRLKALGLQVDASNDKFCKILMQKKEDWKNNEDWKIVQEMYSDETFARKERERIDEIAKLKEEMLTEDVSLYDYLRMDAEQAATYVENNKLKKILESKAEIFYEVYGYLVFLQYRKSLN